MTFNKLQYLQEEYDKLHIEGKTNFIENARFCLMADQYDYKNYHSNGKLTESEFYSVVDLLYELDNLNMLISFVVRNIKVLLQEVDGIESLKPFLEKAVIDEATFLTRINTFLQKQKNC
ncbi:hypothetical protein [Clostridium formicaceticum]|uniref:Uncharacterized protein n=1 Tax=Clostridium formicaceticum TaxID=1497 RepID=A0AAC9WJ29_9CLOT|nr:hypothetical protein [Clostridium formicaceticum]AOY74729.1 hypothetical protein BJL90_01425 [Clostridium formicaceticum]ARE89115.1 hypothetical protein CLFO_35210 [Clostridium formicaceticum]